VGDKKALRGGEEGAIENVWGGHGHDPRGLLTILDNVLTVSESAGAEEWDDKPHPHPGDLR
jgi:hypothetical protein